MEPVSRGKGGKQMGKLEKIREAEKKAQLLLEKAEKEARQIRLSIPDLLEKQDRKLEEKLEQLKSKELEKSVAEIKKLEERLKRKTERDLEAIGEYKHQLEKAATKELRSYILKSGENG
ncbi:MAG: hypothetical protein GF388_05475 [Candidatus Aegiribacteria sp.]|nr:hypothetical protein [Candidatus Aegiribacteria sp.]MBD3294654.1 hypothetical protein [Candidatus Fermentibacteria bacterium]